MATGYIVENRGGQSFGEAQGLDTGQWEPRGSPVDGGGSLELGRWTAKAVGMASITACHPARWQLQQPWLTTRAGSYQRNIASDPYGRQHPAAVRLFRLSKVTV